MTLLSRKLPAVVAALVCMSVSFSPRTVFAEDRPPDDPGSARELARDYCENFSNVAAELRARRQKEELDRLRIDIENKLMEVQQRTAELNKVIAKRDEIVSLASNELLKIYSKMDPELAARQLEKIDINTAASVVRRLKPQLASEILGAMDVQRASQLVQVIANQNSGIQRESKT